MADTIPVRRRRGGRQEPPPPIRAVGTPPPPRHLTQGSANLWREIVGDFILGVDGLTVLQGGLESWDLYQVCRKQIAKEGPTVRAEGGMIRQHPAVKIGHDALREFRMCFRQLGLEPPK